MNLSETWPLFCIGGWMLIVTILLWGNHRLHSAQRAHRIPVYPPAIAATRGPDADWDETWVDVWPTNDGADQVVYDLLFDRLIAMEGLDR